MTAQGCIAIRNPISSCTGTNLSTTGSGWQISASYRYFKSFRHYRGKEEEEERVELGTDVRNYTNLLDLGVNRQFNDRWSLAVTLPLQSIRRTSLYEHDRKSRHETASNGIGDVRISVYSTLFKPNSIGNIQLGLGIKLPTGDYGYKDYFYKDDTTYLLAPVDQSIQPGDGGTGVSLEINASLKVYKNLRFYTNGYYLLNPRNVNGTSTARGSAPSASAIKYRTDVMSVADQYSARAGFNYTVHRFVFGAGLRIEGVPSEDLAGESDGFRRPGYTLGLEPSVSYTWKDYDFFATVPYALARNRVQNTSDKLRSKDSGTYTIGDAAFADYSINFGVAYRFGNSSSTMMNHSHDLEMK
ncbi:MAG: hypothetical protein IT267_08135 [Saprospiraceae bacterium]|nr:hypothetical protein [Saprospiraceae bacterium]